MWRSNTLGGGKIRPAAGIGRRPRRAQGQRDRDEGRHPSCTSGEGATSTIPIVFTGGDPVEQGLVAGLARPGGNLTGFTFLLIELVPKRLELLSELVPEARVIALLVNPSKPECLARRRAASVAHPGGAAPYSEGRHRKRDRRRLRLPRPTARRRAPRRPDPFFNDRREQLVALASRHALATCYEWRE